MKRILSLALAACFSGPVCSADLLQVYTDALANDPQFAAARAQLTATEERVPQARAGLLPSLTASANTNWNDSDLRLSNGSPTIGRQYNSNGYSINLSQPVFRVQNWVQFDQAKLQYAQGLAQFEQARQDLIVRAAQAYFDVKVAEEALAAAQAQKAATSEQLAQAKRNFEVGTSTIVDTHEAQARFDLVTAQEIAAQSDLDVKRQFLVQLTGKDQGALKGLKGQASLERPAPEDINQWASAAEKGSPQVKAQEAALESASREIDRARAGHYPTLDLVASYGKNVQHYNFASGLGTDTRSGVVGLQLAVPLYQGGAVNARQREVVALREKARSELENARRTAAQSARQSYLGVLNGVAQVKALEAGLISSQSALDSNKLGYEVGVRINIDVLNAQQQLYGTRRDLAKARYDTLLAQLRLKAATGSLTEQDVKQINALLEP